AQTALQGAMRVAGPGLAALDVPALGGLRMAAAPQAFRPMDLESGAKGLAAEAKSWADKIAQVDRELDGEYDAYRTSLAQADADKVAASLKERAYYASVWKSIVAPAKDLPAADPRVNPILQALYGYLAPLPARAQRLQRGKAASAKAVEAARDAARASSARLTEADRKTVEELGMSGGSFEDVSAKVDDMHKASPEYMGWLREAYDKTAAWAKAVKVDSSWADQYAWVYADYLENATLAKALSDKELGAAPAP
ncbi:MAG: hypothetical protein KGL53_05630, partial [Elusimicrobia bacterium]|nr:hypothetical protein [Elusimicrobiota bacterium]